MKKLIIFSFVALYLVALMPISIAEAQTRPASLNFSPSSGNIELNSSGQFSVDINVDTGGEQISGVDMTILYNTSEVTYISGIVINTFLTNTAMTFPNSNTSGKLQAGVTITASSSGEPKNYVTGTGTIGRLTFTPATTNTTDTATFSFNKIDDKTDDNTNVVSPDYPNFDILGSAPSATLTFVDYTPPITTAPTITSFTPHEGLHDADIVMIINGTNFTDTEGNVYVGTRSATISSWSDSQIYIIVPQNDSITDTDSGPHQVKVTRTDGKNATADGYIYLATDEPSSDYPNITSIAPRSGEEGYDVVIDVLGVNFGSSAGTLSMGSLDSNVISWSDNHIVITAYGSRIDVSQDTWYPVTVTRTDGLSDTYHGFMVTTGIGFIPLLAGLFILNGGAAILVKRKWFS